MAFGRPRFGIGFEMTITIDSSKRISAQGFDYTTDKSSAVLLLPCAPYVVRLFDYRNVFIEAFFKNGFIETQGTLSHHLGLNETVRLHDLPRQHLQSPVMCVLLDQDYLAPKDA